MMNRREAFKAAAGSAIGVALLPLLPSVPSPAANFGFSIPSGATIDGVIVELEGPTPVRILTS